MHANGREFWEKEEPVPNWPKQALYYNRLDPYFRGKNRLANTETSFAFCELH